MSNILARLPYIHNMFGRQGISLIRSGTTRFSKSQSLGAIRYHGGPSIPKDAPTVNVTFVQPDETLKVVQARVGESLLQTAHRNDIDLEGACEGVCACSTCHLILPQEVYDSVEEPSEDEEDMLDMAFGLTDTSRLGCQITVTEEMDGVSFEMPKATRNFYVGMCPKPQSISSASYHNHVSLFAVYLYDHRWPCA